MEDEKYVVLIKEETPYRAYMFIGENKTRVCDIDKAKRFSNLTITEFEITEAQCIEDVGEWECASPDNVIAIRESDIYNILGKPEKVYFRS